MESTQVDVVLDALVSTMTTGLPDADVIDGQPLAMDAPDCLVIGWSPSRPAAEIRQERTGLQRDRRSETLDVACVASVWRGESDPQSPSDTRAALVALLDEVRDILASNRTLGGVVTRAVLGFDGTLDQAQTKDGATATADFVIQVTTL